MKGATLENRLPVDRFHEANRMGSTEPKSTDLTLRRRVSARLEGWFETPRFARLLTMRW
jgi:hypothetical protein